MSDMRAELEAIDAEIASLRADRAAWRLSPMVFVAAACAQAQCTEARLDEIEMRLEQHGLDELQRAIVRCEHHVVDGHVSRPHR
jgi:hypothetical protein